MDGGPRTSHDFPNSKMGLPTGWTPVAPYDKLGVGPRKSKVENRQLEVSIFFEFPYAASEVGWHVILSVHGPSAHPSK